jgi:hypothetical protein
MDDLVTVTNLILLVETEKAIGCAIIEDGKKKDKVKVWFPKSQIDRCTMTKRGDVGEVDIPKWLAEKNDLDYEDDDVSIIK